MKDSIVKVEFGDESVNVRFNSEILRRFKAICEAEGESMSDKFRQWTIIYIHEHEKGNPQLLLAPREEKSLVEQILEDDAKQPKEFPMTRIRREIVSELAKFVERYPNLSRPTVVKRFALIHGFTVDKVREYIQLLDSQTRR